MKQPNRRPGSLQRSAVTPWAYPPGIAESGVGLLETLTGLGVFLMLAMAGCKAFYDAEAGRNEAASVRGIGNIAIPATAAVGVSAGMAITSIGRGRNAMDRNGSAGDYQGGRE